MLYFLCRVLTGYSGIKLALDAVIREIFQCRIVEIIRLYAMRSRMGLHIYSQVKDVKIFYKICESNYFLPAVIALKGRGSYFLFFDA